MSGRLPPALEEFGQRLREATGARIEEEQRQAAMARRRQRAGRLRRLAVAMGAVVLTGGAAAGAGLVLEQDGSSLPSEPGAGGDLSPGAAAGVVASTATPDPTGGSPWALRVFTNPEGEECVAVGRLRRGQLGQVENPVFRPLPDDAPGICGDVSRSGVVATVEQRTQPAPRTAIYGLSAGNGPVRISLDGTPYRVDARALGAFLLVVNGVQGEDSITLRTLVDGETVSLTLGE